MTNTITAISFKDVELAGMKVSGRWESTPGVLTVQGIGSFEDLSRLFNALHGSVATSEAPPEKAPLQIKIVEEEAQAPKATPPTEAAQIEVVEVAEAPGDMSVFGRLTQLKDVVNELRRRGAADFASVQAKIAELKDAECCPLLDRVANLDDRLKTCCAALQVPGAL